MPAPLAGGIRVLAGQCLGHVNLADNGRAGLLVIFPGHDHVILEPTFKRHGEHGDRILVLDADWAACVRLVPVLPPPSCACTWRIAAGSRRREG